MKTQLIALTLIALTMAACGSNTSRSVTLQPNTITVLVTPTPAAVLTADEVNAADIASLVADENAYRLSLGQTKLSQGLSCTLYSITGGWYIQNDATHSPTLTGVTKRASFLSDGQFQQGNSNISDGMNVLPASLRAIYTNLYMLRCTGYVVITNTGNYPFELYSDDGAVLYLDGARLIDNDGGHGITQKNGYKNLRRGVHAFRLDYAQTGAGAQALILNSNGSAIPAANFQH